ncbi:MBL fold metallo-hydrolase [Thermodesulfobacteriota bacterium]
MVRIEKVDSRIQGIILEDIRTCWLLRDKKTVLIDSGLPVETSNLLSGLEKLALTPQDIDYLALTHIHVDHGGGAGNLAAENPDLKIFVHAKGAKHLANPQKLVDSIKKVYGDDFAAVGAMLGIPSDQIIAIDTGDTIDLGGNSLEVFYTPGHAKHHVVFFDTASDSIFSGDALGSKYKDAPNFVLAPPPDYDKDVAKQSVDLIKGLRPKRINFTHCGAYDLNGQEDFYEKLKDRHDLWTDCIFEIINENRNLSTNQVFEQFVKKLPELNNYPEQFWSFHLSVKGILNYLKRSGRI